MATGIPIRISASLTERARKEAQIQNRSLTEQVEHWARLGQVIESTILSSTTAHFKTASYDERLERTLAAVDTPAARKRAAVSIARKNPVRYGIASPAEAKVVKFRSTRKRRKSLTK